MNIIQKILNAIRHILGSIYRFFSGEGFFHGFLGFLIVIVSVIWIVVFVDRIVMPLFVRSGVDVMVPDLRDLHVMEAERLCLNSGIELIRGSRMRVDNAHRAGTILDQFPVGGMKVKPGRRVEVILSVKDQLILCPEVIGKSPREAYLIADSSGISVNPELNIFQHSTVYPAGVVFKQSPQPKSGIMKGDTLQITVSLGNEPQQIIAPDLVGYRIEEVEFLLAKYFLTLGRVTKYPDKSRRDGEVILQEPPPGTVLKKGDSVRVRIAVTPGKKSEQL